MRYLILTLVCCWSLGTQAQDLHTPAEILGIMDTSQVSYLLRSSEEYIGDFDYTSTTSNYYRQVVVNGEIELELYPLSKEDSVIFMEGEQAFKNGNLDKARSKYIEVHRNNPDFSVAMVWIGQTHALQLNEIKALEWYEKALEVNYCDYMAHWLKADIYKKRKLYDEAVREITTAYILNRNNPLIQETMKVIYKKAKLKYQQWEFSPNIRMVPNGAKEVQVVFDEFWTTYALYKAIWTFEPGYREQMTGSTSEFSLLEEKECLSGLLIMNTNKKGKFQHNRKVPSLSYLNKALNQNLFTEFVIVEIWLRQYPVIAFTQDRETLDKLVDYVIQIRGEKL